MTNNPSIDPLHLLAWLTARSIVRGLPLPVADHGGFRVDTNAPDEVARWVFADRQPGLGQLARSIHAPRYLIKLCGPAEALAAALPPGWQIHPPGYFMRANGAAAEPALGGDYQMRAKRDGQVMEASIYTRTSALAARGYAAETDEVFIYDRIVTQDEHRRKGLGRVVMQALRRMKARADAPELLVATQDGRALYLSLGWEIISPYSTASLPAA